MKIKQTELEGVLVIAPNVFADERGFFMETWNACRYQSEGINAHFIQDNLSFSRKGVLRGLHFQNPTPQGKLITVLAGGIFDVAVDLRAGSSTFGGWTSVVLTGENRWQFWVPEGFAHGFVVLSETALVNYKCTNLYDKVAEQCIRWDDPDIGIRWPCETPILSPKDAAAPFLRDLLLTSLFQHEKTMAV